MKTSVLKYNLKVLKNRIRQGSNGKYKIKIKEFTIPLTNRCNSHCIMCHGIFKENKNKTMYNEEPFDITLEEYMKILPLNLDSKEIFEDDVEIVFCHAESLLNRNIYEIIRHTKKVLPNSKITIVSNGSIPPLKGNEDIVKYISRISFSIDGCTKETFEKIRTPLIFEDTIDNIKKWVEYKKIYKSDIVYRISTVLSGLNIHELPGILKLAAEITEIEAVNVNPLMIPVGRECLSEFQVENISDEIMNKHINEAVVIAKENGIRFDSPGVIRAFYDSEFITEAKSNFYDINMHKYCTNIWSGKVILNREGKFYRICGNIVDMPSQEIIKKYGIPSEGSPWEAYNSRGLYKFRKDMLDGKCLNYCNKCRVGTYYSRMLELNMIEEKKIKFKWLRKEN